MKRRRFFQAMAVAPAVPALLGQQPVMQPGAPPLQAPQNPNPAAAPAKLDTAIPDDAATMKPHFFTADQFAALRKLSEVIMPPIRNAPGALEANAPEFLDFYLGESSKERQTLYKAGLDTLNKQAKQRFTKSFADLDAAQANQILEPLRKPWAYDPPTDPFERFLQAAKADIRTATMNSRQYSAAASAGGSRRFGGAGLYWYPLD